LRQRQAAATKKQENRPQKKQAKMTFYTTLRPAVCLRSAQCAGARASSRPRGRQKKKSVTAKKINRRPPWWVGGSEAKKGLGSDLFFRYYFYRVFKLPSPRNAQKRDKKTPRKSRFWIFGRILCKNFSTRFFL
jgi:hypothetical protein